MRIDVFEKYFDQYDNWFFKHAKAYQSELKALQQAKIPGMSIEIGVGTGKFAEPLGITYGVEPSENMYKIAQKLNINIIKGQAEYLPIKSNVFDWAIMITTICFVEAPFKSIKEMYRILKCGGKSSIGIIDKDSYLGGKYQLNKDKSVFYRDATFFSSKEIITLLKKAKFKHINALQTLFGDENDIESNIQLPEYDFGKESFVVISGYI